MMKLILLILSVFPILVFSGPAVGGDDFQRARGGIIAPRMTVSWDNEKTSLHTYCENMENKIVCSGEVNQTIAIKGLKQMLGCGYKDLWTLCYLDDNGVHAVGVELPQFKNPKKIQTSYNYFCVLDDQGVQCFGNVSGEMRQRLTFFKRPADFTLGCSIEEGQVWCPYKDWGPSPLNYAPLDIQKLSNVSAIVSREFSSSGNDGGLCAISEGKLACWDGQYTNYNLEAPVLKVSLGRIHACALTTKGGVCWGTELQVAARAIQQIEYPDFDYIFLDKLDSVLARYADASSAAKSQYFRHLQAFFEKNLVKDLLISEADFDDITPSRLLMLRLMAPPVMQADSEIFRKNYTPLFQESQPNIELAACRFAKTKKKKCIQDSSLNRKIILVALQSVVEISKSFANDGTSLDFLRLIGAAIADPTNDQKLNEVMIAGNEWSRRHEEFKSSTRTSFIVEVAELAMQQMKELIRP